MEQEEICTVGKCWHHVFIKITMVTHKYYFDYNGTGMEYIESEGIHAVGKCPRYAFIKTKLRSNCQIHCNGTGYGIHRYYQ